MESNLPGSQDHGDANDWGVCLNDDPNDLYETRAFRIQRALETEHFISIELLILIDLVNSMSNFLASYATFDHSSVSDDWCYCLQVCECLFCWLVDNFLVIEGGRDAMLTKCFVGSRSAGRQNRGCNLAQTSTLLLPATGRFGNYRLINHNDRDE
jgi:hypothetical protein